jgi:chromate reductase
MPQRLLLVSGSLRAASTNTAALRTVIEVAPAGTECVLYAGVARLPHFNPDDEAGTLPAAVTELREGIHAADAVLFSTPEYAGDLPGSFKNVLDWTIGDDHSRAIHEKPVGWLNVSTRGALEAHRSLRRVLAYAHADIVEGACVDVPVPAAMVNGDGVVSEPDRRRAIAGALLALLEHARRSPTG